ncbi:TPA: hypothetical protein ACGG75_000956 [Vibrio cholerae]
MATKVIKPAEIERTCDMCGKTKQHFFKKGHASMGWVCMQSERWEKIIVATLSASIPYSPSDDICTDCAREAVDKIIKQIEGNDQ